MWHRSYRAIAAWGRTSDRTLVRALGFTHEPTPCAATLFHVFRRLDRDDLERRLGARAATVLQATTPVDAHPVEGIALDGKTLRGSQKQGAPGAHLLSAVSHRLGLTLAQTGVDDTTNGITAAPTVLANLVLAGRVITVDALLTQRAVAQAIVDGGGDDLMAVNEHHPERYADIALLFGTPPPPPTPPGRRPRPARTGTAGPRSAG